MKKIVCTGDSHTWGQGALGSHDEFRSGVVEGDLRLTNLDSKSYVNLLRQYVNEKTGSSSIQIDINNLDEHILSGKFQIKEFITITDGDISLKINKGIVRIEYLCAPQGGKVQVLLDNKEINTIYNYSNSTTNNYKIFKLDLNEDQNLVTLKPINCKLDIFKIEIYTGGYAVINSGVGSCTTERFLKDFWQDYVENYKPNYVIIEAHSINDWICTIDLDKYYDNLCVMFSKTKELGAIPIMLTVSPIIGFHTSDINMKYYDYIYTSIKLRGIQMF